MSLVEFSMRYLGFLTHIKLQATEKIIHPTSNKKTMEPNVMIIWDQMIAISH